MSLWWFDTFARRSFLRNTSAIVNSLFPFGEDHQFLIPHFNNFLCIVDETHTQI